MKPVHPAPFLRQALLADAVTSAACALMLIAAAGPLAGPLGLPTALMRGAGIFLVPYVALLAVMAMRETLPRILVWAVIVGNALWAIESVLLLVSGWVEPTRAGYAFVIAQAIVVAMYAELQLMGLKRSNPAVA